MKKDLKSIITTKNKLWLSWSKIIHDPNGTVTLISPKFSGPVLNDCEPLVESGKIKLDLTHQYKLHLPKPYIVELEWFSANSQTKEKVEFKKIILKDGSLGKLSLLKDSDSILLDCTGHRTELEAQGLYLFNYDAVLFNFAKEPYNFSKN